MIRQAIHFGICILLVLLTPQTGSAFNYQEHKAIGNAGFSTALRQLVAKGVVRDSLTLANWLSQYAHMAFNPQTNDWFFPELSHKPNQISYGELNALSGDHSPNPLVLQDQLRYQYSALNRVVLTQQSYAERFYTNAPDNELFRLDKQYGYYALFHFAHFYQYGKGLTEHLGQVQKATVEALQIPAQVEHVFKYLNKTNAFESYVTLHALAVHLAQQGGSALHVGDSDKASTYLYYAILYNAYADHFLQDAFSSGHLIVRRSVISGVTNNKALHDFFSRVGLPVVNLNGNAWVARGDGYLNAPNSQWHKAQTYMSTLRPPNTDTCQLVVKATAQSVVEVWEAFARAQTNGQVTLLDSLPQDLAGRQLKKAAAAEQFYVSRFKALTLMPVPYGSDLSRYPLSDSIRQLNRPLFFRDHIRRRVANSATLFAGTLQPFALPNNGTYAIIGGRYLFSPTGCRYKDHYDKAGTIDRWYGFSASFTRGFQFGNSTFSQSDKIASHLTQAQVGVYHKADIWVTNDRYVSCHVYVEAGGAWYNGKLQPVISPMARLELFPLLLSIRKSYPKSLVLPLRLLLPLSVTYAYQFSPKQANQRLLSVEIDLTF